MTEISIVAWLMVGGGLLFGWSPVLAGGIAVVVSLAFVVVVVAMTRRTWKKHRPPRYGPWS